MGIFWAFAAGMIRSNLSVLQGTADCPFCLENLILLQMHAFVAASGHDYAQGKQEGQVAHYGMLRDTRFAEASEDIRGSHLYGLNDEKLGKIDDVIFDHSTGVIRYVVVDTGGWLTSKKFIVPADRLRSSAEHEDDYRVDVTKEQIESFPPYNESDVKDEKRWGDYENKYRSKWETGPVMHRAETDRN